MRLRSMSFKVGQRIWIACDVKAGMFPTERSIRFELSAPERKVVSGFVPERCSDGPVFRGLDPRHLASAP